jgi:hypothetical protein
MRKKIVRWFADKPEEGCATLMFLLVFVVLAIVFFVHPKKAKSAELPVSGFAQVIYSSKTGDTMLDKSRIFIGDFDKTFVLLELAHSGRDDRDPIRMAQRSKLYANGWKMSLGRIGTAGAWTTPNGNVLETINFPAVPGGGFAYGVQGAKKTRYGDLMVDLSGSSASTFEKGNWDRIETSARLTHPIEKRGDISATVELSPSHYAIGVMDFNYILTPDLRLRGALYRNDDVKGANTNGGYLLAIKQFSPKFDFHAQIDAWRSDNSAHDAVSTFGVRTMLKKPLQSITIDHENSQSLGDKILVRFQIGF